MKPLISVIVPITRMGGNLKYIDEWLQAIDMNVYQVILVHDVQDSETGPKLEALLKRINGKKPMLVSGKFGSPGLARNEGFQYVEGKWIAFWDADDQPNHLEFKEMVEAADCINSQLAIGGFSKTDTSTGFVESVNYPRLNSKGSNIPFEPGIWRWAFLTDEIFSIRFTDLRMGEDQVFLSQIGLRGKDIYIHKNSVYSYSINRKGQLTSDRGVLIELSKAMKIELQSHKKKNLPMDLFLISVLLKQSITAFKSMRKELTKQAFWTLFYIIKDAVKYRNGNIFNGIKSLTVFALKMNKKEKSQIFFAFGGFGNQLFQVAAGLSISQNSNFYLDYSHGPKTKEDIDLVREYYLPERVLVSKRFKLGLIRRKFFNLCIRFSSVAKKSARNEKIINLSRGVLERLLQVISVGRWRINSGTGFDAEVAFCGKRYFLGYFQTFQYFFDIHARDTLRRIRLKNPSTLFLEYQREVNSMNSLIVHVRLGDYLRESKFGQLSPQYFQTVIQAAWDTGRFNRICLFSDEPTQAKGFVPSELEDAIWTPSNKLTSTAETFELMRHGKGYVLSNSSFSWWAASLAHDNSPLVIAPNPWFDSEIEPIDLIPRDWIRVSKLDFAKTGIKLQ